MTDNYDYSSSANSSSTNATKKKSKVFVNTAYSDHPEIRKHLKAIEAIINANPELLDKMVTLPFGTGLDTMNEAEVKGTPEFQDILKGKNAFLHATNKWANEKVLPGQVKLLTALTLVRRVNDVTSTESAEMTFDL